MPPRCASGAAVALVWLLGTPAAFAHGDKPHSPEELLRAWSFEPGVVIPLVMSALLYGGGLVRIWRSTRVGVGVQRWQAWAFAAGWFTLVIALVSPLHPWGEALFSAHMTQHELLMLVAAPLLVLGRPMIPFLKALPGAWSYRLAKAANTPSWRQVWQAITLPFVAWLIHTVVLWGWHVPSFFQATIDHEAIHALQHLSFLGSALLFWWAILWGRERRMGYGMAVLYMFSTALHSGLLGVILTFAQVVIYPVYIPTAAWWGLTPLEDQQLGGLIMWVPAGLVYVLAGLILFARWLAESEHRVSATEAAAVALQSKS